MIEYVPRRFDELQARFEATGWFRSERTRDGTVGLNQWNDRRTVFPPTGTVAMKVSPLLVGVDAGEILQGGLDIEIFCEVTEVWTTQVPSAEPYLSAAHRQGYWLAAYKYQVQVGAYGIRYDLDEDPEKHPDSSHFHHRHRTAQGRADGQPVTACEPITFARFMEHAEQFVFEEQVAQGHITLDPDD